MIKGAQKQMIVVRTADSRYFDEAYFVLRKELKTQGRSKYDMLSEANRILEENGMSQEEKRRFRLPRGIVIFFSGIICGGGIVLLLSLLLL